MASARLLSGKHAISSALMTSTISADLRFSSTAVAMLCLKPVTTTSSIGDGSSAANDTGSSAKEQKRAVALPKDSHPRALCLELMIHPHRLIKKGASRRSLRGLRTTIDRSTIELTHRSVHN